MTFDNITDMQVGSTKVESAWFNGEKVWPTTINYGWYGVKFTGSSTTGERTGDLNAHRDLPIQSQMRGCTITTGGVIKWLNPTDWTKHEDGTDATLYHLDVMVYIPDYYLQYIHSDSDNTDEIRIGTTEFEGSTLIKGGYCSAYEGWMSGLDEGLRSIKDKIPTANKTRSVFETQAKSRGNGFHAYTYAMHKAITWLFVVEYACRNSQATYNTVLTPEGYHQGGLGEGVTTGGNDGDYSFVPTGTTDEFGNGTGVTDWQGSSRTYHVPRYRGIENPFGHVWKNTVDTLCPDNSTIWITTNPDKFAATSVPDESDSDWHEFYKDPLSGYTSVLEGNGELFPQGIGGTGGSSSSYYCDRYYTSSGTNTVILGGYPGNGAAAGLFCFYSHYSVGYSFSDIGCRLIYLP